MGYCTPSTDQYIAQCTPWLMCLHNLGDFYICCLASLGPCNMFEGSHSTQNDQMCHFYVLTKFQETVQEL